MGCDIHAFLDYDEICDEKTQKVCSQNLAEINISRNYWLFTLLAGVRGESVQGQNPISEPKGLPQKISNTVYSKAYLCVLDDVEDTDTEGCCTRKDAERWGNKYVDERKQFVHHPDWHSHSWLSLDEIKQVIKQYEKLIETKQLWVKDGESVADGYTLDENWLEKGFKVYHKTEQCYAPIELLAVRDTMKLLESKGHTARFVFWFDN